MSEGSATMISALTWVPRGAARAKPVRFELSPEEIARIEKLAADEEAGETEKRTRKDDNEDEEQEEEDEDAASDDNADNAEDFDSQDEDEAVTEEATPAADGMEDDTPLPAELRMDDYDDEEDVVNALEDADDMDDDEGLEMEFMENGQNTLAFEASMAAEDAEDAEDDDIRATDSILVLAITEDDYSHLEVQVLTDDGHLYTHHDIMLPDFPLALAWMDIPPFVSQEGEQKLIGNYIAVGTFSPEIEIWNLDVLDPIEPSATLGGYDAASKAKKSKKNKVFLPGSHTEAVMALSWNSMFRQALASGSADKTVKVWDVTTQQCSYTFTHHSDKVQAVNWHPTEAWLLATGAFDKTIGLVDCRTAATTIACQLNADIESMTWDPFCNYHLYGSLENGEVFCLDVRKCSKNAHLQEKDNNMVFSFQAHNKTVSNLNFSNKVPGMLATASLDKTVKVWDVQTLQQQADSLDMTPKCIAYKTMNVGKLFSLRFSYDDAFVLATGGDKGMVAVWESDELDVIKQYFEPRVVEKASPYAHLAFEGEASRAVEPEQQTKLVAMDLQIMNKPAEDESWMLDNEGVAGAGLDKKKKKKKAAK